MKIILATGIYPPDIGGPATYTKALAQELTDMKHEVVVVTYGNCTLHIADPWPVLCISKNGGPLLRWWRYSKALRKHAADADVVYAFSSVSAGIPLKFARLTQPKNILRLGGDFLWERYTDRGGTLGLREWYRTIGHLQFAICHWVLRHFDHIVFSSAFQRDIYLDHYKDLPAYSVIENALKGGGTVLHEKHDPFRLLVLGRLVRFKNLPPLLDAIQKLSHVTLTIAGSGPVESELRSQVKKLGIEDRVAFVGNRDGKEKQQLFFEHDLIVLPSLTEISPNTALEARATGLPVLLTEETGLSISLQKGLIIRKLRTSEEITAAIKDAQKKYPEIAARAAEPSTMRSWAQVASEHEDLFRRIT